MNKAIAGMPADMSEVLGEIAEATGTSTKQIAHILIQVSLNLMRDGFLEIGINTETGEVIAMLDDPDAGEEIDPAAYVDGPETVQ
jgi:hypothetical protein